MVSVMELNVFPMRLLHALVPFFEKSKDIFWIQSIDEERQIYVNPAYKIIWGQSCQSLYEDPHSWMDYVHPDDRGFLKSDFDVDKKFIALNNTAAKDLLIYSYRIIRPSGEIRWIYDQRFLVYDENNKVVANGSVIQDITSQKNIERQLQDISPYFSQIAQRCGSVFWILSCDNKTNRQVIMYVSPAYEKIWGRSPQELYQDPSMWINYLLPEDRYVFENQDAKTLAENEKIVKTFRIRRPDGEIRWIRDRSFPLYDDNDQLVSFAGIAEDITEEKNREQALEIAKEEAEISNKAKAEFLANVSHDLRTPMNAILGMAQILSRKNLTAEIKEYINGILTASKSLLCLINDVLDFAKLDAGKLCIDPRPFLLDDLINSLQLTLASMAHDKGIDFILKCVNVPQNLIGDISRIHQILINLLTNSIKFTEQGYVSLKIECLEKTEVKSKLCFTVIDTGIGIPEDKLDKVFERFYQIKSACSSTHHGTGLGLAIVKQLVECMDGSILVTSKIGEGSTFKCILDLTLDNPMANPLKSSHTVDELVNAKVLLVEDNLLNQKVAKTMLKEVGCKVDIAESGERALIMYNEDYDIIFLDVGLPGISGLETAALIRNQSESKRWVPIVAMTAHVLPEEQQKFLDGGMDEIITKPVMQEELLATLRKWIRIGNS